MKPGQYPKVVKAEHRMGDGTGPEWVIPASVSAGELVMGHEIWLVPPGPVGEDENVACIHLMVADAHGNALGVDVDFHLLAAWCDRVRFEQRVIQLRRVEPS